VSALRIGGFCDRNIKMKLDLSFVLLLIVVSIAHGQNGPAIKLEPCEVPGTSPNVKEKAKCGSLEVFEDRAKRSGRKIKLKIVVFPATSKNKEPDPLFYIPGGPGSSATEDAPFVAQDFARVRERRDLVFVDQRGTGGSNPLNCTFYDPDDAQSFLGHWNPPEQVRECLRQLQPKADLRLYVTSIAMDDLDDVRAALGYKKINISGGSYGTRATLNYVKRHGKNVRSIILQGVAPSNQFMPRDFPEHTQRALEGVIAECLAETDCRAVFPNARSDAQTVLDRLKKGPIEVEVKYNERLARVRLSRDLAGEAVRYMLYQGGSASRVPLVLNLAANGNFVPLAEAALLYRRAIVSSGSNGLYLSVTCAEDLPWADNVTRVQADDATFLGDYRLRQQKEACSFWPRGELTADYAEPTRSNVPALIFTGQWDPVTPPVYGETAAKYLPNGLHITVPSAGHGFGGLDGIGCLSDLSTSFIEAGSVKNLDTTCVSSIKRKGFVLSLPKPAK